jgi:hypothetical protein
MNEIDTRVSGAEDIQSIIDEVAERSGESPELIRKLLYNAFDYIRAGLQNPERPYIMWNKLFTFKMMPKRINQYIEKIETGKVQYRPGMEMKLERYRRYLELCKKYYNGSW